MAGTVGEGGKRSKEASRAAICSDSEFTPKVCELVDSVPVSVPSSVAPIKLLVDSVSVLSRDGPIESLVDSLRPLPRSESTEPLIDSISVLFGSELIGP